MIFRKKIEFCYHWNALIFDHLSIPHSGRNTNMAEKNAPTSIVVDSCNEISVTVTVETKKLVDSYYEELCKKIPELLEVANIDDFLGEQEKLCNIELSDEQIHFVGYIYQQLFSLFDCEGKSNFYKLVRPKYLGLVQHLCQRHLADAAESWYKTNKWIFSSIHLDFFNRIRRVLWVIHPNLDKLLATFYSWKISLDRYIATGVSDKERGPRITFVIDPAPIQDDGFVCKFASFSSYDEYKGFVGKYDAQMKFILEYYSLYTHQCMWCHPSFISVTAHQLSKGYSLESRYIPNAMTIKICDNACEKYIPDLTPKVSYQEKIDKETYMMMAVKAVLFSECNDGSDVLMKYNKIVDELWCGSKPTELFHKKLGDLEVEVAQYYKNTLDNVVKQNEWDASISNMQLLSSLMAFNLGTKAPRPFANTKETYSANGRTTRPKTTVLSDIPIKVDKRLGRKKKW